MPRHPFRSARLILACAGLLNGIAAFGSGAPSTGFCETLSPAEKAACGVSLLSPVQASALDALVARDVSLAREGEVSGFSTTFLQRRTAAEQARAGLDRLGADPRARLDTLVARAIATPVSAKAAFTYQPRPAAPLESVKPPGPELHGDISFTVGGGKGGSFYGTSMDLTLVDPEQRYSITVGYSVFRGKGCCYYPYLPFAP